MPVGQPIRPTRRRFFAVLAIGLSTVVGVVAAEAVCRLDGQYTRHRAAAARLLKAMPHAERAPAAGPPRVSKALLVRGAAGKYETRVAVQDVAVPPKPARTVRILCIGDSFTDGPFVDLADTWPKRLEMLLTGAAEAGDPSYEVWNLGMQGAGLLQATRILEEACARFEPDLILHQLLVNDFLLLDYPDAPVFTYRAPPQTRLHLRFYFWRFRSRYAVLDTSWVQVLQFHGNPDLLHWRLARTFHRDLVAVATQAGVPYVAFLVPANIWNGGDYPLREMHTSIAAAISPQTAHYFDLLEPLEAAFPSGADHWVEPDLPDSHPDATLYAFYAEQVRSYLRTHALVFSG